MKKTINIFAYILIFINLMSIDVQCNELEYVGEYLEDIGISKQYCENIVEYIDNLDISEEEIKIIVDQTRAVFSNIKENEQYEDLSLLQLMNIYNNFVNISDKLKIDLDMDFKSKEVIFKDNNNGNILLKSDLNDLKTYVDNYNNLEISENDYNDIINIVKNEVISNSKNSNSIEEKSLDDNSSDLVFNDDNSIDNTSIEESEVDNKDLSLQAKQAKVYLIIFACGALAILIGVIFK